MFACACVRVCAGWLVRAVRLYLFLRIIGTFHRDVKFATDRRAGAWGTQPFTGRLGAALSASPNKGVANGIPAFMPSHACPPATLPGHWCKPLLRISDRLLLLFAPLQFLLPWSRWTLMRCSKSLFSRKTKQDTCQQLFCHADVQHELFV